MKALADRFATPTETALRLAGIAIAQFQAHFRHEQTSLMTQETIGA
jgi:hypothetical protein